jgi:VacB/RNase II family 3'-5' exoribonuclease
LETIKEPASIRNNIKDLSQLLWCSIDNDDSKDLDQLTLAEKLPNQKTRLWVAIADVDALVAKNSPIDQSAQVNTTSVYTPAKIFAMLPEKLSTNLTSLNEKENRLAVVIQMDITAAGEIVEPSIYRAMVYNKAQLNYRTVGEWLESKGNIPEKVKLVDGLENALKCQHEITQVLKERRQEMGALSLETAEVEAKWRKDTGLLLEPVKHNAAHQLIEHFMIAANSVVATFLKNEKISSLRRVVRIPKRWDRIVDLAAENGEKLPQVPDSQALDQFLIKMREKDPTTFPDLSLTVIKLLGNGEYVVEKSGDLPLGHFGLALREYTHSTAPNRRYPDLITQRQLKAYLEKQSLPYEDTELEILALHCSQQEDAATKVERQMNKTAAALLLSSSIGSIFDGIVTGASDKGTWVRIFNPPAEGKVVKGFEGVDVGDHVRVRLVGVDVPKGFIDFIVLNK